MAQQTQTYRPDLDMPGKFDGVEKDELSAEEKREFSARSERLIVIPDTDGDNLSTGLYDVHSPSGRIYTVDITEPGRCQRDDGATCPDLEYNDVARCKHRARVGIEMRENGLPAPGEEASGYLYALSDYMEECQMRIAALLDEARELNRLVERIEQA